jgi:hypothetical protein
MLRFVRPMGKEPPTAIDNPAQSAVLVAFDVLSAGSRRAF